eukprot:s564_g16.t1
MEDAELQALLAKLRLEKFTEDLKTLGVESKADLAYLEDSDLEKLGLPLVPRRKLLEAAGGQWRQATSAAEAPPVSPKVTPSREPRPAHPAVPTVPAVPAEEVPEVKDPPQGASHGKEEEEDHAEEELSEKAQEELQQLLRDLRNIREDFATVNCLDLTSRSKLAGLPARVALRTMGLLGTGYSFFMEGIKKPAAALAARSANAKFKGTEPYQDWVKLLEGFVAANKLSESTKEALEGLSREQALKVMGFTSELRFLAGPVYRGEAELEVRTRLWSVQSEAMMVPVLPRGKGEDGRSRSPRNGRGKRTVAAPPVTDQFPKWKQHVETFIELNDLDARSAEMLRESSPMAALHVIGLLGTENSFLLRGVRTPGAVVATRLRKAATVGRGEAFAQLAKLMEDFITANRLAGEVAERFRGLPRSQALQVMGFSAEAGDQVDHDKEHDPFIIKEVGAEDEVRRRMDALQGASEQRSCDSTYRFKTAPFIQIRRTFGAMASDALTTAGKFMFDDVLMAQKLPSAVMQRFNECLITGDPTPEEDQKVIADAIYSWARELGAIDFAHWFFPLRGGGGAVGGMLGAFKRDTLIDLDFGSKYTTKPMKACLPHERLFQGETDGSSFPNGGLRVTHSAAAFTTWDRASPPFVLDKCLYIPCAFVTHFGKCIDEKTPLLRSMDAVKASGLRLLKAINIGTDAKTMHSYLGWEQEFFVLSASMFKARPDLVNTGRP